MEQEQKEAKNSVNLEPVQHLSPRLQRKLLKREQKQRKHFRSSGKSYPFVSAQSVSTSTEVPAGRYSSRARQRLILAIASLVIVMLLTLGLIGFAIATHPAIWIMLLMLFILVLFISAAISINIVFNRKNSH